MLTDLKLHLLLDAVVAARFISPSETKRLLNHLKWFAGEHIKEEVNNQVYTVNEKNEISHMTKHHMADYAYL